MKTLRFWFDFLLVSSFSLLGSDRTGPNILKNNGFWPLELGPLSFLAQPAFLSLLLPLCTVVLTTILPTTGCHSWAGRPRGSQYSTPHRPVCSLLLRSTWPSSFCIWYPPPPGDNPPYVSQRRFPSVKWFSLKSFTISSIIQGWMLIIRPSLLKVFLRSFIENEYATIFTFTFKISLSAST